MTIAAIDLDGLETFAIFKVWDPTIMDFLPNEVEIEEGTFGIKLIEKGSAVTNITNVNYTHPLPRVSVPTYEDASRTVSLVNEKNESVEVVYSELNQKINNSVKENKQYISDNNENTGSRNFTKKVKSEGESFLVKGKVSVELKQVNPVFTTVVTITAGNVSSDAVTLLADKLVANGLEVKLLEEEVVVGDVNIADVNNPVGINIAVGTTASYKSQDEYKTRTVTIESIEHESSGRVIVPIETSEATNTYSY